MLIEDLKLFDLKEKIRSLLLGCQIGVTIIFGAYVYGFRLQTNTKLLLTLEKDSKVEKKESCFHKIKI